MKKETYVIIGSLLAAASIVGFLIIPEIDLFTMARQELADTKAQLDQIRIYNENIKKLGEKYNLTPEEIEGFLSILPEGQKRPDLLIQLETLAGASGLVMNSVNFSEIATPKNVEIPTPSPDNEAMFPTKSETTAQPKESIQEPAANDYKTLRVDLALSGGYAAFKNYLHSVEDIENNPRLMDVVSFSLAGALDENQNTIQSFSVGLYVYYR